MKEIFVSGYTFPDAYHNALVALQECGEETDCTDWNCKQKEVGLTMLVQDPLCEPMLSAFMPCGPAELEQYRQEMLDGIMDFEVYAGKFPYTYHSRMIEWGAGIDQYRFVCEELKRNPSSRRAVIDFRYNPADIISGDPACLQHIQYFIRDGALDCKVLFRSNDAVKATAMNAFALIMLQKRLADELGVEVGTYTHRANSFHAYERDFKALEYAVQRIKMKDEPKPAICYKHGWDELMEEAKPEIRKKIEELYRKEIGQTWQPY